jgi:Mce-associated membrane protein
MTVADDVATNDDVTDSADPEPESVTAETVDAECDRGDASRRRIIWTRIIGYGVLPGVALLLTLGAGYLKWADTSARDAQVAGRESVRAATEGTIAMLSYKPDTVEQDLGTAEDRMTGKFHDDYKSLINDVVAPGSKQKQISALATVPAAASVSATENHAVVLVFVNQTVIIGKDAPTATASTVRVTLDRVGNRWLISGFDPV